jgi:hypothetical protein
VKDVGREPDQGVALHINPQQLGILALRRELALRNGFVMRNVLLGM